MEVVGILIRKEEGVGGFRDGVPEFTIEVGVDTIPYRSRTIHSYNAGSVGVVVLPLNKD